MNLAICSLASGSSGNCYLIKSNNTAILADAGISARQIEQRLGALGVGCGDIEAVMITHEHSDHVKGLGVTKKSSSMKICANEKTAAKSGMENCSGFELFSTGDNFTVGDILVNTFPLSHDAEDPCGYSFCCDGKRISVVTDTGIVTEEIFQAVKDSDILVLESNHDVNILKMGRYPWFLKQRILGDKGHLSNEAAAELLLRIHREAEKKRRLILLAHLSQENNFPEMALTTVSNILEEAGVAVGKEMKLVTLSRTEPSSLFAI